MEVETCLWERMEFKAYLARLLSRLEAYQPGMWELLLPTNQRHYTQEMVDLMFIARSTRENFGKLDTLLKRDDVSFAVGWKDRPESFPPESSGELRRQFEDARRRLGAFESTIDL